MTPIIYRSYDVFAQAVAQRCQGDAPLPETHRWDCVFVYGHPTAGFCLRATQAGWSVTLNGVETSRRQHIAAPFANLQAAVCYITTDHACHKHERLS